MFIAVLFKQVEIRDKSRNTIIRQRTRLTDIPDHVTKAKGKRARRTTRMKDSRWTSRSTEWKKKVGRSDGVS